MYIGWTKHLKEDKDKEAFQSKILGSKQVLERLKQIVDQEEKDLDQTELDPKSFDNPSWAYKQAYKNGFRAGLRITQKLVNLDEQVTYTKKDK